MSKRVAFIVPIGFEIPQELQDVAPILDFDLPSRDELKHALDHTINSIGDPKARPKFDDTATDRILNAVTGMTELEAEGALARAVAEHRKKLPNVSLDEFCGTLMAVKTEAVKRSDVLELMPSANMSDVGGMPELKTWLNLTKHAFGKNARDAGVDRPKGMLVCGSPEDRATFY